MTDHIASVRAQAKREAELASSQRIKDSIQEWRDATGASGDAWPDDWELEFWHAGYKHGAYSVIEWLASRLTRESIAEELSKHHFIHGIGRSNSCHCGVQVGEFAEYRNHEADAILALFTEDLRAVDQ